MKQSDVIPHRAYAFGNHRPGDPNVWVDPTTFRTAALYVPAIVMDVPVGGGLIAMVANYHPDTAHAAQAGQASVEEALKYSVRDQIALSSAIQAIMKAGVGTPELRRQIEQQRAKLPKGWTARNLRTLQLKMTWDGYVAAHAAHLKNEQAEQVAAMREVQERNARIDEVLTRAKALGIDATKSRMGVPIRLEIDTFNLLLDAFESGERETP